MLTLDHTLHLAELIVLAGLAWRVISTCNRVINALRDFPPHRHVGPQVVYPSGFAPPPIETITVDGLGDGPRK